MFRATKENPFKGPHQQSGTITSGAEPQKAAAALIMIHGRGATAESILTLTNEFPAEGYHLAAPQAAGFQWYPHSFLAPAERNEPGLSSGLQAIFDIISGLVEKGIPKKKTIILGFSQGACLASEFVARHPDRYGGLIALSGGLIGDEVSAGDYYGSLNKTPVFLGCSNVDPHIPRERVDKTGKILDELGAMVTKKIYPGMGHTVNEDEIKHARQILDKVNNT